MLEAVSGKKMTFYQDEILKYSLPRPSRNVWKISTIVSHFTLLYLFMESI